MTNDQSDLLDEAISRNLAAVLSLPSAGMLRHCKSRFLARHEGGFLLESAAGEEPLVKSLIDAKQPCGVSFKSGTLKAVFTTRIRRLCPRWPVNADTVVDAVLLDMPAEVKAVQRRANYRVAVPTDSDLRVRVWRIAARTYLKDNPPHAQEVLAELRDVSVGGMGVRFVGKDAQPPKISPEDRLRVQFTANGQSFLVEGRMRNPSGPQSPDVISTGVTFKKLEDNIEGRQILAQLTRIVGELQRGELRRYRMGLVKPA